MQILIFGDSITYGAWDTEGGWTGRLRNYLDQQILSDPNYFCLTYNLGVSGDTTRNLLNRFEAETEARFDPSEPHIFIFSIGTNDALYNSKTQTNWVPIDEFEENLKQLIELARVYSETIVFLGDTPIDQEKLDPIPWSPDNSAKNEFIEEYNAVIKNVSHEEQIHFIDLLSEFKKQDYKKLLHDGDHPNPEGHKLIFEIVKEYLEKNKII